MDGFRYQRRGLPQNGAEESLPEPETPAHVIRGAQETPDDFADEAAAQRPSEARAERMASGATRTAAPKAEQKTGPSARKAPAPKKAKNAHPMSKKAKERRARQDPPNDHRRALRRDRRRAAVIGIRAGSRLVDIKQTLDRGDGVFYPNIYVNDIPLQGKTLDEAAALVTQQVQSLISSFKITLRTQDGRSWDITGDSLNMQVQRRRPARPALGHRPYGVILHAL